MALTIFDLPEEIISAVISWLATPEEWLQLRNNDAELTCKSDLCSLSLVSRSLHRLTLPLLFATVTVDGAEWLDGCPESRSTVELTCFCTSFADLVKLVLI